MGIVFPLNLVVLISILPLARNERVDNKLRPWNILVFLTHASRAGVGEVENYCCSNSIFFFIYQVIILKLINGWLLYVGIIFNSTGIRQNKLHYAGILSSLTDPYISSKLCQNPGQKVIRFLTLYETQATYRKIPKISPGAYIFQRPFLRGLFLEGLIFGGTYLRREICFSKSIGLAL